MDRSDWKLVVAIILYEFVLIFGLGMLGYGLSMVGASPVFSIILLMVYRWMPRLDEW